jgi:putative oxidoreductase
MVARPKDLPTSFGLLILRVGVGIFMLAHGWPKLQALLGGKFDLVGDPLGIGPQASTIGIVSAEFGCAILLILGLFTRLGGLGIAFAMGVAAFTVHINDPWFMTGEGPSKEPAMLFLIPALALIFTGAGRFSLDALLFRGRDRYGATKEGEFVSR